MSNAHDAQPTEMPVLLRERSWRVVHACDSIREVADLVEAQIAAGMRPFVLTGEAASGSVSLLNTWSEVRTWRAHLDDASLAHHLTRGSVVHAHTFASAMAGIRSGLTTVYDLRACVEDFAVAQEQCAERSWLARSFRAAEDFVMPRAGAVVVHSSLMRAACLKRGVPEADLFMVPAPLQVVANPDHGWLRRAFDFPEDVITIFARPTLVEDETLVRAFAQVAAEVPGARLFVASSSAQTLPLRRFAQQHEVDDRIFFLAAGDEQPALTAADIVVAGRPLFPDESARGRIEAIPLAVNGTAVSAMAAGCCLLAADCSAHRDLTPEGRGCLWFGAGSETKDKAVELAHRLSFLARNSDLRRALAEAGRQHLAQSRDPERIGKMYKDIYRHAEWKRKRGDDAHSKTPLLVPSQVSA